MDKVSDDPKGRLKIQSSKKTGFPSKESGLFYSKLKNSFSRPRGRSDVAVGKVTRIDKPFRCCLVIFKRVKRCR